MVQPERAVGLEVDQVVEDQLGVLRLAVGREPHHLVFAGVDLEAGVVGEGRIEQPERMREVQSPCASRDRLPRPNADRRGRPLADAVHREDHRLVERRRKERAGRVALVMLGEQQLAFPIEVRDRTRAARRAAAASGTASPSSRAASPCERSGSPGRKREIGLEQPLELEERLVVEGDVVDLAERDAALAQAIARARDAGNRSRASCA